MKDTRELREERAGVLKEARQLNDKGTLTASEKNKLAGLIERAKRLKADIEAEDRAIGSAALGGGAIQTPEQTETRGGLNPQQQEHRAAFSAYLRGGITAIRDEHRSALQKYKAPAFEMRDMGSGGQGAYPGATTGFFVPVGFLQEVEKALKYTSSFLDPDVTRMLDTETGQILPVPTENDLSVTGELIGEGAQVSTADVVLGQILLGSYKYSSKMVKVSLELLQDSSFDFESFLIQSFAGRLDRILTPHFTTGSGSNQPLGVVTGTVSNGTLIAAAGSSANDGTGAGPNTIGSDDIVNLIHAIDPLYRKDAGLMMHDSTLKALKKVKDKYGRPLWDIAFNAPTLRPTLDGIPVYLNAYMDQLQTNTSSPPVTRNAVIYGNFKHYVVRRVKSMSVLRLDQRFADYGQCGFLAFARFDGQPLFGTNATGAAYPFALLQNTY